MGKSTLVRHFAEKSHARFIKIEGERPDESTTRETELTAFAEQLAAQTGCDRTPPHDWIRAFIRLAHEVNDRERTIILLDEASWLAFGESRFANILRTAWENYLKPHERLIVVVCGSVSSWIRDERGLRRVRGSAEADGRELGIVARVTAICRAFAP